VKKHFVRTVRNRNGKREPFREPADKPPQITHVYLKTRMLIVIIIYVYYIIYERYCNKNIFVLCSRRRDRQSVTNQTYRYT
jgi:hypothetical protein